MQAAEIVFRLIEDAMSESGTHDGAYQQCIEQWVQQIFGDAFSSEEPSEYKPAQYESRHEEERIPSEPERPYMKKNRVHMPVDE